MKATQYHCLVKINATSYMLAGGTYANETWMYDWTSGVWTQKRNLTWGRYYMACSLCTYANGSQAVLTAGEPNNSKTEIK